jgi:hypothetical protein
MGVGNGGNEFEKRGVGCTITQPCSRFKKIRWSALQAVKALGMARAGWIPDYHRTRRPHVDLAPLVAQGLLLRARVEGWDEPVYIHPDHAGLARQAASDALRPSFTTILSPFDPVVWDRRRAHRCQGAPEDRRVRGEGGVFRARRARQRGLAARRRAGLAALRALARLHARERQRTSPKSVDSPSITLSRSLRQIKPGKSALPKLLVLSG